MNWSSYDEEDYPEDDDQLEASTVPCPSCGVEIHEDSQRCPECGEYVVFSHRPWSHKPTWLRRIALALLILALVGFLAIELRHWLGIRLVEPGQPTGTLRVRE